LKKHNSQTYCCAQFLPSSFYALVTCNIFTKSRCAHIVILIPCYMSRAVVLVYTRDTSWELTIIIHHFNPRFQIFYTLQTLLEELEKTKTIYPRKFILS